MSLDELTQEGARVVSRCEVWVEGQQVEEPLILNGGVRYDATSRVLRSCEVSLVGDIPALPTDPLAPIGSELRLYRGAKDWTGEIFEEPLGRYAFNSTDVTRENKSIEISGYDYSHLVTEARWETPFLITQGTNLATAISNAAQSRIPTLWQDPNLVSTTSTVPTIVWGEEVDNDPMADIKSLAQADGLEVSFDRRGRLTLEPTPDPDSVDPRWDYTAGESTLYLTASKNLIGRPYNVVIARGETEGNVSPVSAVAEDDDPNSASYIGRYRKPYFMTSSFIETESQAFKAAQGELNRLKGLAEIVTINLVPHPGLDVWQVIRAFDPELKLDARYVIDRAVIPLRPGISSITTRRRRL